MPTENRSSNTEMVSVPRELVARIARAGCWPNDAEELRALLAQSVEQRHGEPVDLKCWSCKAEFTLKERSDCDGCCWKCGVEIDLDSYVETFAKLAETAADQVVKLLAQLRDANDTLAEQHQSEPVALPSRNKVQQFEKLTRFEREVYAAGRAVGRNDCLDEIAKLGQLYTHPAPAVQKDGAKVHIEVRECEGCNHIGIDDAHSALAACHECDWSGPEPVEDKCPACDRENVIAAACPDCGSRYVLATSKTIEVPTDAGKVERLRALVKSYEEIAESHADACAEALTRLAERDALLRELDDAWNSHDGKDRFGKLMQKVEALSASAEPSAMAARIKSAACAVCASHPCACAELGAPEVFVCQVDETCGEGGFKVAHLGTNEDGERLSAEDSARAAEYAKRLFQKLTGSPVERDERAEFEKSFPNLDHTLCSHPDWQDQYESVKAGDMWNGWQARAALERKP